MTQQTTTITPRSAEQINAVHKLNASAPELAPTPPVPTGGGYFNPSDGPATELRMRIAKFLGGDASVVDGLASQSAFTNNDFERKNQERVRAFVSGPSVPYGGGAYPMAPNITHFNADRLNAGEPVRLEMDNPMLRSLGNRLALYGGGNAWDEMSHVMTSSATTDPAGFAQTQFTGRYFSSADPTTWRPARGGMNGGGYAYGIESSGAGADVNAGAVMTAPLAEKLLLPL